MKWGWMVPEDSLLPGPADWPDDLRFAGSTTIQPDPLIMGAIGLNYLLEAAIADLVDNSIDAGASSVLVRFIRRGSQLAGLCVVDDGRGMDEGRLRDAMALGKRREYEQSDLGHFGPRSQSCLSGPGSQPDRCQPSRGFGPLWDTVGYRRLPQKALRSTLWSNIPRSCSFIGAGFRKCSKPGRWSCGKTF